MFSWRKIMQENKIIEYVWRVIKHNKFAGYVTSSSMIDAQRRAVDFYGKEVWVERVVNNSKA
jgi:hypothetical protein